MAARKERFRHLADIGRGAYGVVSKAIDTTTGGTVALKRISLTGQDFGVPCAGLREIAALQALVHPNVVRLLDVLYEPAHVCLVLECVAEDLRRHLARTPTGPPPFSHAHFLRQILCALDFCHSHGMVHRDLKPENVLVTTKGVLKLADFGLARAFALPVGAQTPYVVTLWYRAPELLLGAERYSVGVDMWSAGCIFAELVRRRALWAGQTEVETLFRMFRLLGTPNETVWPGVSSLPHFSPAFPKWPAQRLTKRVRGLEGDDSALELLQAMLTMDPEGRISSKEALEHPFVAVRRAAEGAEATPKEPPPP